jgi:hypothetical protein
MRRFLAAALAAGSMLAMSGAQAGDSSVSGTILAPTFRITQIPSVEVPVYGDPSASNGVYFRQARCAYVLGGADTNGLLGWVVAFDETVEGDGTHTFTATSDAGNISVGFYEDLGTCENLPASTPSPEPGGTFIASPGDEAGAIPFYAKYAIIVVEDATQANFTFSISDGIDDGDGR